MDAVKHDCALVLGWRHPACLLPIKNALGVAGAATEEGQAGEGLCWHNQVPQSPSGSAGGRAVPHLCVFPLYAGACACARPITSAVPITSRELLSKGSLAVGLVAFSSLDAVTKRNRRCKSSERRRSKVQRERHLLQPCADVLPPLRIYCRSSLLGDCSSRRGATPSVGGWGRYVIR